MPVKRLREWGPDPSPTADSRVQSQCLIFEFLRLRGSGFTLFFFFSINFFYIILQFFGIKIIRTSSKEMSKNKYQMLIDG